MLAPPTLASIAPTDAAPVVSATLNGPTVVEAAPAPLRSRVMVVGVPDVGAAHVAPTEGSARGRNETTASLANAALMFQRTCADFNGVPDSGSGVVTLPPANVVSWPAGIVVQFDPSVEYWICVLTPVAADTSNTAVPELVVCLSFGSDISEDPIPNSNVAMVEFPALSVTVVVTLCQP